MESCHTLVAKDLDDCLLVTEMPDFYLSGKLAEPTT